MAISLIGNTSTIEDKRVYSVIEKICTTFRSDIHAKCDFKISRETKQSNAQHLVEYEKQMIYEENQTSGNFMQQPMDSYVCGINTSSESILIRSYALFALQTHSCRIRVHLLRREVTLTKRGNFLTSNLYHKRRNA